jgi:hypothetical protein
LQYHAFADYLDGLGNHEHFTINLWWYIERIKYHVCNGHAPHMADEMAATPEEMCQTYKLLIVARRRCMWPSHQQELGSACPSPFVTWVVRGVGVSEAISDGLYPGHGTGSFA